MPSPGVTKTAILSWTTRRVSTVKWDANSKLAVALGMVSLTRTSEAIKKTNFLFLSAQHSLFIHHSAHVCGICGGKQTPLVLFLVYISCFVCVCALVCECNVCLFSSLPACMCAFSFKVTFVCSVCFSFVYQHILCLRAEKQQYAKALSCLISLSARLFHHPTHYRPEQRDGPWLQHSESCVELSLQRCSRTFFAHNPLLFSFVNVQPLRVHFTIL